MRDLPDIFYFELGITGECRPGYRLCQGSGDENRVAGTIKAINRWVIATGF